jgi:hypothetical protein
VQEPAVDAAVSVVPLMLQVPVVTAKVTKPVPLPPVELSVDVPDVATEAGVATATSVFCATFVTAALTVMSLLTVVAAA